jgi:hypothetical protein
MAKSRSVIEQTSQCGRGQLTYPWGEDGLLNVFEFPNHLVAVVSSPTERSGSGITAGAVSKKITKLIILTLLGDSMMLVLTLFIIGRCRSIKTYRSPFMLCELLAATEFFLAHW